MTNPVFYAMDGVRFLLEVTIETGADVTTLVGSALTVQARRVGGSVAVDGVAVLESGGVDVTFAPGVLGPGLWWVQTRVIPLGHSGITLRDPVTILVLASV